MCLFLLAHRTSTSASNLQRLGFLRRYKLCSLLQSLQRLQLFRHHCLRQLSEGVQLPYPDRKGPPFSCTIFLRLLLKWSYHHKLLT